MPLIDWVGISVDVFAQFTHCLVALFKLTTLDEPGWNLEDVRKRVDVFEILDRACETIDYVPVVLGMVDAEGPRSGLFFKTTYLLRAIKALFLAEMPPDKVPDSLRLSNGAADGVADFMGGPPITDDFLASLAGEPWLSDIFDFPNLGTELAGSTSSAPLPW